MGRRIIEIVALLLGLVITAGVVIAIPMKSYNEYKDYLAEIEKQNEDKKQQAIKPELESITAELKEGVKYFANDLAEARPEHFIVTANYTKEGQEPWSELVEEGDFTISSPADFYAKGGKITVKYKGHATTVEVSLEPVVLESIEITVNPYTIKYQAGTSFDASGMIVTAHYNDGSAKVLADDQYTAPEKLLSIGDTAVTVSFTDGEVTKSADVAIGVSEVLDNGAVASIVIVDGAIVNAGQQIATAAMEVNAVYENGNRRPLAQDEYTIDAALGAVEFGKMYHLTVSYNADPTKTAATDVKVRQTLQGENGTIVGGSKKTEDEYAVINGVITKLENQVSFAGNFSQSVLKGEDAYLVLTLNSAASTVGDITVRCSNSYNVFFNGANADDGYMMKPLQINTILDLTINGREVKVPATVILRGCGPYENYAPLYGIYYEFKIEDVELDAGANKVMFNFKRSTVGATNCWDESPSTLNIDYVHFDSFGSEIPDEYTIVGIEVSEGFAPQYGQRFDEAEIPVVAILDNGTRIAAPEGSYTIEITGGAEGDEIFKFGKYTITAYLKDDPSNKSSIEVEIPVFEHFVVLTAGVEIVDGRVLYYFTGESTGYTVEDIEFFDGGTIYPITVELGDTTFRFYVDVTETGYGITYWPHIRLNGVNYDNGANNNGDVRDRGLQFTDGQYETHGGKTYTITTQYSMPTLVVTKAADIPDGPINPDITYDANIDNSYVSDKVLIDTLIYGSAGTDTSGKDKSEEYPGGIGNLDALNAYVTYTFTLDAAGKVDFIWNIAGSKWNGSGNDGLTNAADHMTVFLNGAKVDMDGIALPAGDGTNTSEWWNTQKVVIKDVELDAGTYTFTCIINTQGVGLNAGAMEIYSSSATVHVHTEETIPAVAPDCTNPGLTAGVKCSVCGTVLTPQVEDPATGHAFDNENDADCNNGCGFVRDVECSHSYTGPVLEDAEGFYQKCDNENCDSTQRVNAPVADSYNASVDNEFSSAKQNQATIIYGNNGAWGVTTNGSYKKEDGAPEGAIGGLDSAGKYVYYEFVLDKAGTVDIAWSIAGSKWNGSGNDGLADMAAHMTITIDGKPVDVSGIALSADGEYPWWNLQNLVIKDVALEAGVHTFKCDITAAGGLNVGPMKISSNKGVAARSANVSAVDVYEQGGRVYYALTTELVGYTVDDIRLWGDSGDYTLTYENGKIIVDLSDYEIGHTLLPHMSLAGKNYVNGSNKNGDVYGNGLTFESKSVKLGDKYYLLSEQYSMPAISVVAAVANITAADIVVEGDQVYYLLTYDIIGYDPESFEFFDGSTIYEYESISQNGNSYTFKFNRTGNTGAIWPHLRIDGVNIGNANGDVHITVTTKTVVHGGQSYTLSNQWSMPVVEVTPFVCEHSFTGPILEGAEGFYQECDNELCDETQSASAPVADSYKASIDNGFTSDRANTLSLTYAKYGVWGIQTNGELKAEEGAPAGAIGGLDKAGKYVYYEFYLDKPGTVDILWNIAGSNWNGSGNDGLADMANHMTITIDGKPVDISGLALPAGEGNLTWWNLQQFILKDVALEAGAHIIKCDVNAAGGLNVGPMQILSNKDVEARSCVVTKIDLLVRGDKIYYALYANLKGYTADDVRIWGDSDHSFIAEAGDNGETLILIDVTNFANNAKINPHMSLAGKNYVNNANANGDVLGGITYEEKTVKHGDKYYQIITEWSMPSLMVVEAVSKATKADLFVENDRVYYTLTYEVIGYDPATFEFFDGSTIYSYESFSVNGNTVVFRFDITDYTKEVWPHLRIEGANWDGINGDVKVSTTEKSVELNGRTYTLKEQWGMPSVVYA